MEQEGYLQTVGLIKDHLQNIWKTLEHTTWFENKQKRCRIPTKDRQRAGGTWEDAPRRTQAENNEVLSLENNEMSSLASQHS